MIRSMTGFGSARASSQGFTLKVECRSVNNRGLDTRIYVPREWSWLEPFVLQEIKARMQRGRVEVRVDAQRDAGAEQTRHVDRDRFVAVARELEQVAGEAGMKAQVSVGDVLSFKDVLISEDASMEQVGEDEAFQRAVCEALDELVDNRAREGEVLVETLRALVDGLEADVAHVAQAVPTVQQEYRTRLEERVRDALAKFEVGEVDEARLVQEVVFYADRSDISEELQRAGSHLARLRELFDTPGGEAVGKQIDFYLQELIREVNTMGSKSSSTRITDRVVAMKSAIEKMREQAANVE